MVISIDELIDAVGKKVDYHSSDIKIKGVLSDIHICKNLVKIVIKSADNVALNVVDFGAEDDFMKVCEFVPAEKDKTGQEAS